MNLLKITRERPHLLQANPLHKSKYCDEEGELGAKEATKNSTAGPVDPIWSALSTHSKHLGSTTLMEHRIPMLKGTAPIR